MVTHAAANAADVDPYLAWAQATGFAAVLRADDDLLRVAIEFASDRQRQAFARWASQRMQGQPASLRLAPHYLRAVGQKGCRFICVDVAVNALAAVAAKVHRLKVGFVGNAEQAPPPKNVRVSTADFNSPLMKPQAIRRLRQAVAAGGKGTIKGLDFFKLVKAVSPPAPAKTQAYEAPAPLMAVIDFGCAFAHPCFSRGEGTRVIHLWDQGRAADAGWQKELAASWPWTDQADFGYGREANAASLGALMGGVRGAAQAIHRTLSPARFEEACYVGAATPELIEPWSHGTAVLGVAAAWPHPWIETTQKPDAAADADVIFVQLPQAAIEDLCGSWVCTYLLDAIEYIRLKAGNRPVVLNISVGTHGGPHDGGSLLESAIEDAITKHAPGLSVVLAAGNAAHKLGHAVATIPGGQAAELCWVVPERDPTQSFLEFWYPQVSPSHAPRIEVRRRATAAPVLDGGRPVFDKGQGPCAALLQVPQSRAGQASGMALWALAPTLDAGQTGMGTAPAGVWTAMVHNPSVAPIEVHAWIERDEPGVPPLSDRPDAILVAPPGSAFEVNDAFTLTGQATGAGSWVVGGYELDRPDGRRPPEPTADSGRGPARGAGRADRPGPDALAPADRWEHGLTRGLRVLANRSPEPGLELPDIDSKGFAALRGTSLAAPWVVRQIYNLVAGDAGLKTKGAIRTRLSTAAPQPGPAIYWR